MSFTFIKFPKKFLGSEEWQKPRKYSKAEALLYLLHESKPHSIGQYAKVWQWSKSTVSVFLEKVAQEYLAERLPNGSPNDCRTQKQKRVSELDYSAERLPNGSPNDCRTTPYCRDIENPPILSSTKVESNIIPPKGERDFLQELDGEYQEIVSEWLSYKRERKETYKSVRSMQAFVAKLTKLSNGNPKIAREIINQSIANNWAGIFQLKIDQRNDDNKSHPYRPSSTVFIGKSYGKSSI